MSYAGGAALQAAIWQRLSVLDALAGVPVLDAVPPEVSPQNYVLIGPEEVEDASDGSGGGAEHRFQVSVVTSLQGFANAKALAVVISDSLVDAGLVLARGRLVGLWFQKAVARKLDNGAIRRVDMTFRARIEV